MQTDITNEVYGARALYGVIVAGTALLLVATLSSYTPAATAPAQQQQAAKAPTTIETVVVTPAT